MKKLLLVGILALMSLGGLRAENPTLMKYQALVTDAQGKPMVSAPVAFNIAVREGSPTGGVVMSESVTTTTSELGIAYINIGGNAGNVTLDDLDWAGTTYFLDMSVDRGNGMESLGCTQIMSVPRAIYATTAGSVELTSPSGKRFKVAIDDNGQVVAQPVAE